MQMDELLCSVSSLTYLNSTPTDVIAPGGHTNTERGYLKILGPKLIEHLKTDSEINMQDVPVFVSKNDCHPLTVE